MRLVAFVVVAVLATPAAADPEQDFRAAGELAARNDPRAVAAYEALGALRPASVWTDDAWIEAARIAEQQSDYDRARRDLGEAIAISSDDQLVRRAKRDLDRLAQLTGGGQWSAVAAEHQRLVTAIAAGGDPTPALEALEALAKQHAAYPRGAAMRIVLARGWESEDEVDHAVALLRDAIRRARGIDQDRARIELVRMLIRHRELAAARSELALVADAGTRASLERALATAESRQIARRIICALLGALAIITAWLLRRRTGSWGAAARAIVRPPTEVFYFAPIAIVIGVIASTGNPLVGTAVIEILVVAGVIAWISGVTTEAARRRGAIPTRHALVHAAVVTLAIVASVYVVLDRARLLDLVAETWRTGPGH